MGEGERSLVRKNRMHGRPEMQYGASKDLKDGGRGRAILDETKAVGWG